jgi:hypothetical protein
MLRIFYTCRDLIEDGFKGKTIFLYFQWHLQQYIDVSTRLDFLLLLFHNYLTIFLRL